MSSHASHAAPLCIHRTIVESEWIDYNGHMNDGFYVVAFTFATDALQDHVGIDERYRRDSGCSIYTVEAHVRYLREVKQGAPLRFETYVVGVDEKRLHLLHAMYHEQQSYLAATHELMLLHVDQGQQRAVAFPDEIRARLDSVRRQHQNLEMPVSCCPGMRKL